MSRWVWVTVVAVTAAACFVESEPAGTSVGVTGGASATSVDATTDPDTSTSTGTDPSTSASTSTSTSTSTSASADTSTGQRPEQHVFFVTTLQVPGNVGGIAGADNACSEAAAGLPEGVAEGRSFAAYLWLAGSDPVQRLNPIGPIIAPSGDVLAPDIEALQQVDEIAFLPGGSPLAENAEVWIGDVESTCADWTLADAQGTYAIPSTGVWHTGPGGGCSQSRHLYCLSL